MILEPESPEGPPSAREKAAIHTARSFGGPEPVPNLGTWLVIGDKLGDNAQVRLIAQGLGWPVEERRLAFLPPYQKGRPPFRPSLFHLDRERSDPLEPPWPDLVITVGRRPSMAALWIQEQSQGRTRLVILGRPKRWIDRFGLVIAPSQYLVPPRANVLSLEFPLLQLDEARVRDAAHRWEARFAALSRPLYAVLVGGETKPFRFDPQVARDLVAAARGYVLKGGGSLFVTTSRRTPEAVADTIENLLPPGSTFHRWTQGGEENPYLALLGLADRFIVTGDSMSMIMEVARLGKPLAILGFPTRQGPRTWMQRIGRQLARPGSSWTLLREGLYRLGLPVFARDLTRIHQRLYERGAAVPLGAPWPPPGPPLEDELPKVLGRVRELVTRDSGGAL